MGITGARTHTHTHLEQNRNLLSLHHATFRVSRARHICTRASYLTSTGKRPDWRRKRRSIALHASSLSVAGKRDGRGTAARHGSLGCQEMTIYRQHSMAVCATISTLQGSHLSAEGCFFFSPSKCVELEHGKRKHQRSAHLGHLSNFLFTSGGRHRDQWQQENKVWWSHSCIKCCTLRTYKSLNYRSTFLIFPFGQILRKKAINVSSSLKYQAERRP